MGWTRLDLPLVLGTIVTADPDRARVAGFFIHLAIGEGFALGYAAGFALLDTATWWLGALFGLVHVGVALTILVPLLPGVHPRMASDRAGPASTAELEPPGLLGLNYGVADTRGRDRCAPRVRDRARSAAHGALTCPIARLVRSATTGSSATPAPPRSSRRDGAIDWLCAPRFDGDPLFGRLVGGPAAGTFRVGPACRLSDPVARRYRPGTATLETVWEIDGGAAHARPRGWWPSWPAASCRRRCSCAG